MSPWYGGKPQRPTITEKCPKPGTTDTQGQSRVRRLLRHAPTKQDRLHPAPPEVAEFLVAVVERRRVDFAGGEYLVRGAKGQKGVPSFKPVMEFGRSFVAQGGQRLFRGRLHRSLDIVVERAAETPDCAVEQRGCLAGRDSGEDVRGRFTQTALGENLAGQRPAG